MKASLFFLFGLIFLYVGIIYTGDKTKVHPDKCRVVDKYIDNDYILGITHDTVTVYDGDRYVGKCHRDSLWQLLDKDNE